MKFLSPSVSLNHSSLLLLQLFPRHYPSAYFFKINIYFDNELFSCNARLNSEYERLLKVTGNVVNECRLEVSVYDYDQFSVDECIGYCWLTLGRLNVSSNNEAPTVFWAEVLPFDDNNGVCSCLEGKFL